MTAQQRREAEARRQAEEAQRRVAAEQQRVRAEAEALCAAVAQVLSQWLESQGINFSDLETRSGVPRQTIRDVARQRHGVAVFNLFRMVLGLRGKGSQFFAEVERVLERRE